MPDRGSLAMQGVKETARNLLRVLGLYEAVRQRWVNRPSLRYLCWNAGYRLAGAPDGSPIPPTRLIYLAILSREVSWFLRSGKMAYEAIVRVLQQNDLHVGAFDSILDFGCGCGRIMRYWKSLAGPRLFGTDYNPELITWCRKNLGDFASFGVNDLSPPLDFERERFDFVYAVSIFTHLTRELQTAWMRELARVLKTGGYLLMTVHGESRLYQLNPGERERFRRGEMIIKWEEAVGTNVCGVYHPRRYVRARLAKGFEVVDFVPRGGRDTDQDIFLLRKPVEDQDMR